MNDPELRILRSVLSAIHVIKHSVERITEQHSAQSHQQHPPPALEISIPPAITDYCRAEDDERPQKRRREFRRELLEVSTFLAAITAAGFTGLTWIQIYRQTSSIEKSAEAAKVAAVAAKDSADLSRQVAESTQAAIVNVNCAQSFSITQQRFIECGLINDGKSTAINATGEVSMVLQTYPSGRVIKRFPSMRLSKGFLTPQSAAQGSVLIEGLEPNSISRDERVVVINVVASYENGFGHTISNTYCWQAMREAMINFGTSGNSFWGYGLVDCKRVAETEARNAYYAEHDLKGK